MGSFDENNGVLTPQESKKLKKSSGGKNVNLMSHEEAVRRIEVDKAALLAGMPEDAAMNMRL